MNSLHDIVDEIGVFESGVLAALRAYLNEANILDLIQSNTELHGALQQTPMFWNEFHYHTAVIVYVNLGNIFDNDSRSYGLNRLLNLITLSSDKLVIAFRDKHLAQLTKLANDASSIWQTIKNVRSKLIAHRDRFPDDASKQVVIETARTKTVEELLDKLQEILELLNGSPLGEVSKISFSRSRCLDIASSEISSLLSSLQRGYATVG